jgi:hypothetical protein
MFSDTAPCSPYVKIEVIRYSETSVNIQTTRRYAPEDGNFRNYGFKNLISYITLFNCYQVSVFWYEPIWMQSVAGQPFANLGTISVCAMRLSCWEKERCSVQLPGEFKMRQPLFKNTDLIANISSDWRVSIFCSIYPTFQLARHRSPTKRKKIKGRIFSEIKCYNQWNYYSGSF